MTEFTGGETQVESLLVSLVELLESLLLVSLQVCGMYLVCHSCY
jgi:hypothetical protein